MATWESYCELFPTIDPSDVRRIATQIGLNNRDVVVDALLEWQSRDPNHTKGTASVHFPGPADTSPTSIDELRFTKPPAVVSLFTSLFSEKLASQETALPMVLEEMKGFCRNIYADPLPLNVKCLHFVALSCVNAIPADHPFSSQLLQWLDKEYHSLEHIIEQSALEQSRKYSNLSLPSVSNGPLFRSWSNVFLTEGGTFDRIFSAFEAIDYKSDHHYKSLWENCKHLGVPLRARVAVFKACFQRDSPRGELTDMMPLLTQGCPVHLLDEMTQILLGKWTYDEKRNSYAEDVFISISQRMVPHCSAFLRDALFVRLTKALTQPYAGVRAAKALSELRHVVPEEVVRQFLELIDTKNRDSTSYFDETEYLKVLANLGESVPQTMRLQVYNFFKARFSTDRSWKVVEPVAILLPTLTPEQKTETITFLTRGYVEERKKSQRDSGSFVRSFVPLAPMLPDEAGATILEYEDWETCLKLWKDSPHRNSSGRWKEAFLQRLARNERQMYHSAVDSVFQLLVTPADRARGVVALMERSLLGPFHYRQEICRDLVYVLEKHIPAEELQSSVMQALARGVSLHEADAKKLRISLDHFCDLLHSALYKTSICVDVIRFVRDYCATAPPTPGKQVLQEAFVAKRDQEVAKEQATAAAVLVLPDDATGLLEALGVAKRKSDWKLQDQLLEKLTALTGRGPLTSFDVDAVIANSDYRITAMLSDPAITPLTAEQAEKCWTDSMQAVDPSRKDCDKQRLCVLLRLLKHDFRDDPLKRDTFFTLYFKMLGHVFYREGSVENYVNDNWVAQPYVSGTVIDESFSHAAFDVIPSIIELCPGTEMIRKLADCLSGLIFSREPKKFDQDKSEKVCERALEAWPRVFQALSPSSQSTVANSLFAKCTSDDHFSRLATLAKSWNSEVCPNLQDQLTELLIARLMHCMDARVTSALELLTADNQLKLFNELWPQAQRLLGDKNDDGKRRAKGFLWTVAYSFSPLVLGTIAERVLYVVIQDGYKLRDYWKRLPLSDQSRFVELVRTSLERTVSNERTETVDGVGHILDHLRTTKAPYSPMEDALLNIIAQNAREQLGRYSFDRLARCYFNSKQATPAAEDALAQMLFKRSNEIIEPVVRILPSSGKIVLGHLELYQVAAADPPVPSAVMARASVTATSGSQENGSEILTCERSCETMTLSLSVDEVQRKASKVSSAPPTIAR